jgi:hypothetical protein
VAAVQDEDLVEDFAADAADEPFGDRVRSRSTDRDLDDVGADRREHGVEGRDELGVAIPDEEPDPGAGVLEIGHQVACELGQPLPVRMGGDAEDPQASGGISTAKNTYSLRRKTVSMWNRSQATIPSA